MYLHCSTDKYFPTVIAILTFIALHREYSSVTTLIENFITLDTAKASSLLKYNPTQVLSHSLGCPFYVFLIPSYCFFFFAFPKGQFALHFSSVDVILSMYSPSIQQPNLPFRIHPTILITSSVSFFCSHPVDLIDEHIGYSEVTVNQQSFSSSLRVCLFVLQMLKII